MWCIPPEQNAAFVAHMEQVLEVYKRPYNPFRPVVCMDEQAKQLISEVVRPLPLAPGHPERIDHEYVREGQCTVWMFVEPLIGWRSVRTTDRRTGVDWAHQVQQLVNDPHYAKVERITLVCDNLNTHNLGSLYEAFEPAEALRIARKIELVYTPKHGSWLNAAEPELSATNSPVSWSPHRDPPGSGPARTHLEKLPQPQPRRHRLALHHRQRPNQTPPPLS